MRRGWLYTGPPAERVPRRQPSAEKRDELLLVRKAIYGTNRSKISNQATPEADPALQHESTRRTLPFTRLLIR